VQVRGDRIAAPDQDQLRILELLHVGADRGADGVLVAGEARGGADGAVEQRGAKLVEETQRHRLALHQAHGAAIAVREDGLRVARSDFAQALRDLVDRSLPADLFEFAFTLLAHAAHRMQHAIRRIGALDVARDLGAEHAGSGRMVRVATHRGGHAVLDGDEDGAGIGAVVGAGGADLGDAHSESVPGKKTSRNQYFIRFRLASLRTGPAFPAGLDFIW